MLFLIAPAFSAFADLTLDPFFAIAWAKGA